MADAPMPLYARLRDGLRAGILGGQLEPGEKLPSEAELAIAHGVSRITVRQALGDLQKEGLIVRLQGKGAFVSSVRSSQSLNRLQGLGEALATGGQSVHSQRLSMKRLKAPGAVGFHLSLPKGAEVWQMIMLRYVDREPISVNCSWFPVLLGERIARLDLSGRDLIDVLEKDVQVPVAQARLDISAAAMPRREARWLKVAQGSPALCVQRILCDAADSPLQFENVTYRADAFSYKLDVRR